MSNKTTWAVLSDGRYLRIYFNNGEDKVFAPLRVEDLQAYAELHYLTVNNKPLNATGEDAKAKKLNYAECHADFLAAQHKEGLFDALILGGPGAITSSLRDALPEALQGLVIAEVAEDLTLLSSDVIEAQLAALI